MINNRQAGRRRGRNNPRQNGGNGNRGNGDSGNRIDSRARGNAAQLLEKYRNLARDAQLAGDRVNVEYYLQFADHYFRVLADNRARQEEQQNRFRRPDERGDDFEQDGEEGEDTLDQSGDDGFGDPRQERPQDSRRQEPRPRRERPARAERQEPLQRIANDDGDNEQDGDIGLPGLPPSIVRSDDVDAPEAEAAAPVVEEEAPAKPRRGRRPRQPEAAE
ncbi:MAG TPA: DUF4167 domain-containing protein [Sphingobium sp.]|nr:DUF4167 domain-containing protein [Sphingobium sp.]